MKPYIRKGEDGWYCGTFKETLEYYLDGTLEFDSLDNTKFQLVCHGVSPRAAYDNWNKGCKENSPLLAWTAASFKGFNYDIDPRTATGHFLRFLAQSCGIKFKPTDSDAEVRKSMGVK